MDEINKKKNLRISQAMRGPIDRKDSSQSSCIDQDGIEQDSIFCY